MEKRGISAIVATVLIILITVAAVAIIWTSIIPMIRQNLDFTGVNVRLDVVGSEGYTVYDPVQKIVTIQVKRGPDNETVFKNIKIVISFKGNSYSQVVNAPEPNQAKTYSFNITSYVLAYGGPESVSVIPIFIKGSSSKEGTASSKVAFSEGSIPPIPGNLPNFGEGECTPGQKQVCGNSIGICRPGNRTCLAGNFWGGCADGYVGPSAEVCDGLDNDCNGAVDNGLSCACTTPGVTRPTTCGVGACARTGTETCTGGNWIGNTCVAGTPTITCSSGWCGDWSNGCGGILSCTCTSGYCNSTTEGICKQCLINSQCDDGNSCTTDTCSSGTCSHTAVTPVCPSASTVACGLAITPTNGCGTCSGTGTYCATGSCSGGVCSSPPTYERLSGRCNESGTITLTCSPGYKIYTYTSTYGETSWDRYPPYTFNPNGCTNCYSGGVWRACGSCTIGGSSCTVTYNNNNCGECHTGCWKDGNMVIWCQPI